MKLTKQKEEKNRWNSNIQKLPKRNTRFQSDETNERNFIFCLFYSLYTPHSFNKHILCTKKKKKKKQ